MTTTEYPPRVSGKALWAGRILAAVPVLMLLLSATMKLARVDNVREGFAHFGYSPKVIVPLGVIELACTILFLIPRTAVLGAILLTGYFGGAIATHLRAGEPALIGALSFGILIWLSLFLREPRVRDLIPLRRV